MTVLILLLCTVAALFIHRTFVRPILDWFEQREYAERMRGAGKGKAGQVSIIYVPREALSKWDARFIELAEHVAGWSKGPRKRIGAAIVRPNRSIASLGYNGPPRGFNDAVFLNMTRDEQHAVVIHAEDNAIRQAAPGEDLSACTLYVSPLFPCAICADRIVRAGIRRVVAYCGHISPDWRASADEAERIFNQAGVECLFTMD